MRGAKQTCEKFKHAYESRFDLYKKIYYVYLHLSIELC